MSLLPHLGSVSQHLSNLRSYIPDRISLTTTQKIVVVSVSASVAIVGVLARYLRRKKRVVDPSKFRRNFSTKRSRTSGIRSPNGDVVSTASSGRRSGAFSNIYGERHVRQSSVITSEKASIASGSLVSGGQTIPDAGDGTHLTPQQLGVMAWNYKLG